MLAKILTNVMGPQRFSSVVKNLKLYRTEKSKINKTLQQTTRKAKHEENSKLQITYSEDEQETVEKN